MGTDVTRVTPAQGITTMDHLKPAASNRPQAATQASSAAATAGEAATATASPPPVATAEGERRAGEGPDRRKSGVDRRAGMDRRQLTREQSGYTGPERRSGKDRRDPTGLERRRGPGRRRSDERREAEEGEMNAHQFEFVMAVEAYKKVNKRLYPTWTEILEVLRQLGYRKVLPRGINLENVPEAEIETAEGTEPVEPEPERSAA